ncbi:hypothetical protein [Rhizobium grahamii]|uniref:Uncharacterized protein n=1 Tax=Rhizobium grahamii TaxID=1120045 RepID=A0A370KEA2_9HYPH|nr:hypothetical protein [Rhizobium grahamii]RDJ01987.1 hypothetical protein B5K06_32975 [Rhizobium grahamii]
MMNATTRLAMLAISGNRSGDSWIAGSMILADFLDRVPNDIDIHHASGNALSDAFDRDLRSLIRAGFKVSSFLQLENELEVKFKRLGTAVVLNWVIETGETPQLVADRELGTRLTLAEVLAYKVARFKEDPLSKHGEDLRALLPLRRQRIPEFMSLGILDIGPVEREQERSGNSTSRPAPEEPSADADVKLLSDRT